MWILTISEIGRAGQPDSTVTTVHQTHYAACQALYGKYDPLSIRGGANSGTVGGLNGEVFQASHVWSIREYRLVKP